MTEVAQPPAPQEKKPTSTFELIGVLRTLGTVFLLTVLEWLRIRKRQAEDKQAIAETDLAILQKQTVVKEQMDAKSSSDIIDEFLASDKASDGAGKPAAGD